MKIGFITAEYPPRNIGGAGISSKLIVQTLREKGHSVDVYVLNGEEKNERKEYIELPSGKLDRVPKILDKNISAYRNLPDLSQYDVVHSYGPAHLPGVIMRSKPPVVATVINFSWTCINPQYYLQKGCPNYGIRQAIKNSKKDYSGIDTVLAPLIEFVGKSVSKQADQITVQTGGMRQILANCGYDPSTITVIPNLIDPAFCLPRDSASSRKSTLVFVGRLEEKKGVFELVKTFSNMSPSICEEWSLKIYGDGPLKNQIREYIDKTDRRVINMSYCPYDEMPKTVYADAGAVIHSSKYPEPFSRVWLEAMGTGTPIVCSDNPSSRCVLDGIAEFYDPFDHDTLHRSLARIMRSEKYRNQLGELGRETASRYKPDHVVSRYVELYHQVQS